MGGVSSTCIVPKESPSLRATSAGVAEGTRSVVTSHLKPDLMGTRAEVPKWLKVELDVKSKK